MWQMYSKAMGVVVWLRPHERDSEIAVTLRYWDMRWER